MCYNFEFWLFERPFLLVFMPYPHTFVLYFKSNSMRKFMIVFMALLLPLSVLEMRADDEDAVIKIPISVIQEESILEGLL